MVFSSITFLFAFLPIALGLYFLVPRSWKNGVLFLISLVFYAWGEPVYVVLMLFSTLLDYTCGRMVRRCDERKSKAGTKFWLALSVAANLGLLGFFKYSGFAVSSLNHLLGLSLPVPSPSLPIGISFYTFQTMSYTIDVYRRRVDVQKNILSFGAYVAMFPQLIAGPIVRYVDVAKELDERKETLEGFACGVRRFLCGLGKKVLLANTIGQVWDGIQSSTLSELSVLTAWAGILTFAFQIYFDFSGYSDMAIGLGSMMGFHFPENFDHPYASRSVSEFWRRWHMTLGGWFREYVYIPLGGNRVGPLKLLRNLLVVWFLTGLWHGASWNFVLWGLYFGALIALEKFLLAKPLQRAPAAVGHIYAMAAVLLGWVLFSFESMADAGAYFGALFGAGGAFLDGQALSLLRENGLMLAVMAVCSLPMGKRISDAVLARDEKPGWFLLEVLALAALLVLSVAFLVDASYNPFLYFRF